MRRLSVTSWVALVLVLGSHPGHTQNKRNAAPPSLPSQVKVFEKFVRTSTAAEIIASFPRERPDVKFKTLISEDLNDDSYLDFVILHEGRFLCGSGGCAMHAYLANGNGRYSRVLDLSSHTSPRILPRKTRGFKDIAAVAFTVNERPIWSIHQWNGKEYRLEYDQFCGRAALEYCLDTSSSMFIDRIVQPDAYRVTPGARAYDEPGGKELKDVPDEPSIIGRVRGQDWYLVQIWKDEAGFVDGKSVVRSKLP